jgi:integrase
MPRRATGLNAAKARTAGPGRYGDGNGLYLVVRSADSRSWVFRYVRNGTMREMGLGSACGGSAAVTLAEARQRAGELMKRVRAGADPLADRETERAALKAEKQLAAVRGISFRTVAGYYLVAHGFGWKSAKHRLLWASTLETYAAPHIGDLPVADIGTEHVLAALQPIWQAKPETAGRVRGRIEAVLDYAKVRGWRSGENPARWKGHLDQLLPAQSRIAPVEHHAALPYNEIGAFMVALRLQQGISAKALEFAILTAARTGDALAASWGEVDLREAVWTVPANRMKVGKEHRVPLSEPAMALLTDMAKLRASDDPALTIFPGARAGRPLSNMAMLMTLRRMERADLTAHGFRSTFRDWAAERTAYPAEVAEMALAHAVGNAVEAAYRRGDLFDKRRRLMDDWAAFCAAPQATGRVVPLRQSVGA